MLRGPFTRVTKCLMHPAVSRNNRQPGVNTGFKRIIDKRQTLHRGQKHLRINSVTSMIGAGVLVGISRRQFRIAGRDTGPEFTADCRAQTVDKPVVMGTGKLLIKVPQTIKVIVEGTLPRFVSAKDIILKVIGDLGVDGATYCAIEFTGSAISALSVEERMTICNMAIEAGGKNGIIAADEKTIEYVRARTAKPFECFYSDDDASYLKVLNYKAEEFVPVVALPYSPDNMSTAKDASDWKLDRAYIGSCTGGKLTDFIMAAEVLKDKKVSIDTFLVPATREVEAAFDAISFEGRTLKQIFMDAGCIEPAPPSCAACLGGPVDTFGRCNNAEVCVSTTNRNFPGRMGSKDSKTILASAATAAASAVAGHIADPREI